jgi:hypothetical protein
MVGEQYDCNINAVHMPKTKNLNIQSQSRLSGFSGRFVLHDFKKKKSTKEQKQNTQKERTFKTHLK